MHHSKAWADNYPAHGQIWLPESHKPQIPPKDPGKPFPDLLEEYAEKSVLPGGKLMTWAELRPAFAKWRYPCAERASAHGLIARNNQDEYG